MSTTNPWISSNPAVATISNTGLVTGISAGTTTITYTNSNGCLKTETITINPLPLVNIEDIIVCLNSNNQWSSNPVINTNLNSSIYSFSWFYNDSLLPNTKSSITPTQLGTYKVVVTSNSSGCSAEDSATITGSSPIIVTANVLEDFSSNQTIVVEATGGINPYFYSLNGSVPQTSNIFQVATPGKYNIKVTDQSNCNSSEICVYVFIYDKFFTPNGDEFNDTWNIKAQDKTKVMNVSIFDRYGNLIKKFNPLNDRWDGSFNGEQLFSNDFWFIFDYENCEGEFKQFKSHFSLKR